MASTDGTPDTADLAADNARLRARVAELEAERDDLLVPDEPDPATIARAAGLEGGFDETAVEPAGLTWEAYNR